MPTKKPRRTFDRILEVTLALFNRFGEPNVSTNQLCGELGISPGNLFYHHPTRDALVLGLFAQYQSALQVALAENASAYASSMPAHAPWLEGGSAPLNQLAWLCHDLAQVAWTYRFLFRDLSDLVSRHRALEEGLPPLMQQQAAALMAALRQQAWQAEDADVNALKLWTGPMLATLTGCMALDGVMDPRERLRNNEDKVIRRAVGLALGLIRPSLRAPDRAMLGRHLARSDQLGSDPWWLLPAES